VSVLLRQPHGFEDLLPLWVGERVNSPPHRRDDYLMVAVNGRCPHEEREAASGGFEAHASSESIGGEA
jgi:hypothetical protein